MSDISHQELYKFLTKALDFDENRIIKEFDSLNHLYIQLEKRLKTMPCKKLSTYFNFYNSHLCRTPTTRRSDCKLFKENLLNKIRNILLNDYSNPRHNSKSESQELIFQPPEHQNEFKTYLLIKQCKFEHDLQSLKLSIEENFEILQSSDQFSESEFNSIIQTTESSSIGKSKMATEPLTSNRVH